MARICAALERRIVRASAAATARGQPSASTSSRGSPNGRSKPPIQCRSAGSRARQRSWQAHGGACSAVEPQSSRPSRAERDDDRLARARSAAEVDAKQQRRRFGIMPHLRPSGGRCMWAIRQPSPERLLRRPSIDDTKGTRCPMNPTTQARRRRPSRPCRRRSRSAQTKPTGQRRSKERGKHDAQEEPGQAVPVSGGS